MYFVRNRRGPQGPVGKYKYQYQDLGSTWGPETVALPLPYVRSRSSNDQTIGEMPSAARTAKYRFVMRCIEKLVKPGAGRGRSFAAPR